MSTRNNDPQSQDIPLENRVPLPSPGTHNAEAVERPRILSVYFEESAIIMSQDITDEQKSTKLGELEDLVRAWDQRNLREVAERKEMDRELIADQHNVIELTRSSRADAAQELAEEEEKRDAAEKELRLEKRKSAEAQRRSESTARQLVCAEDDLKRCRKHKEDFIERLKDSEERELEHMKERAALTSNKEAGKVHPGQTVYLEDLIALKRENTALRTQVRMGHYLLIFSWTMGWMLMHYEGWVVFLVMCVLVSAAVWIENSPQYAWVREYEAYR